MTSGLKVVIGLLLATLLTSSIRLRTLLRSIIFFPVLVSTVAVGITFAVLMHPSRGLINTSLAAVGVDGPGWLTDPDIALLSVAFVDVWKGVGIALVIFIAGILSIPEEYNDTARLEGGGGSGSATSSSRSAGTRRSRSSCCRSSAACARST